MKKIVSVVLALVFVLALAACSSTSSSAASSAAASSAAPAASSGASGEASSQPAASGGGEQLKVAMLLPGPINDKGWNAKAYQGLQLIEKNLGAKVVYTENVDASDYEELFRGYGDMGFDLIFGHGFQFGDAAMAVAPDYPDSFFIVTSTSIKQEPNLCGLQNKNDEQGYLAGVVAALETKTNIVGTVGGTEMPPIVAYNKGFEMGAKSINPDIKVLANLTGNFSDGAAAKQMAEAMIQEGADIITHDANAAGLGVLEAVNEAKEGVLAVGCIDDQYDLAPDRVITSAMNDLGTAMLRAAEFYQEGSLEPMAYNFGVAEGTVFLADFRDYPMSEENKAKVEEVLEKMKNGEISLSIQAELAS